MSSIFVVEDDEALRYAYAATLRAAGHEVRAFADYEGVVEGLEGPGAPDLLIMDLMLPSGTPNGYAVARMARHRRWQLPIIFVTGFPEVRRHLPKDEIVLLKPILDGDLLSTVVAALPKQPH